MGYYLEKDSKGNPLPDIGKYDALIAAGAKPAKVISLVPFPDDLVCVVENNHWDAAGYCYSVPEMIRFAVPDGRDRRWLHVPGAAEISGYKPEEEDPS